MQTLAELGQASAQLEPNPAEFAPSLTHSSNLKTMSHSKEDQEIKNDIERQLKCGTSVLDVGITLLVWDPDRPSLNDQGPPPGAH